MRLFKLFTTTLLLGLVGLFFYENSAVFTTSLPFALDLYIREEVNWAHPLYGVLLFAAFLGFLAGVGLLLKPFLYMRRMLGQERQEKEKALAAARLPALPPSERAPEDPPVQEAESAEDDAKQPKEPSPHT